MRAHMGRSTLPDPVQAGVDQNRRPSTARRISSVLFVKLGSLLVKLPTRASHAELRFLAPLFVMRSSVVSWFRLGQRLFLSAADGDWPRLYCVRSRILWVNYSLRSGFAAVHRSWAAVM